jgi:hypothetical protein
MKQVSQRKRAYGSEHNEIALRLSAYPGNNVLAVLTDVDSEWCRIVIRGGCIVNFDGRESSNNTELCRSDSNDESRCKIMIAGSKFGLKWSFR